MNILSFHNSTEASAAIYINGEIKSAVSEERFNRIKNFHGFPYNSISYLLKKYKIKFKDLDYVVYGLIKSTLPDAETLLKIDEKFKKIPKQFRTRFHERIDSEIKWNKRHLKELFMYAKKKKILQ